MTENKMLWVGLFVLGAALTWGVYVPTVHRATAMLGSNLRAFLFVGVAYFLTAVLVPLLFIFVLGDPTIKKDPAPNFNLLPVLWGLGAGVMGAAGALCVIFAAAKATEGGGSPIYIAPLVFAGAPIVNTIVSMVYFEHNLKMPDWRFFLGLVLAACGAAMVMLFKPAPDKPAHGHGPKPNAAIVAEADLREPIVCSFCQTPYLPTAHVLACPKCGAPIPRGTTT